MDMEEWQGSSKHVIHIIELALCVLGHGNGKNVGPCCGTEVAWAWA